jgi:hypothetical protein
LFYPTKACQNINVACSNKLIHSTTFVLKLVRLEKHLRIIGLSNNELPFSFKPFEEFYKVFTSSLIQILELPQQFGSSQDSFVLPF